MGLTFSWSPSAIKCLGNIEPELSFVFHLRRITFCGVRLSVETAPHPEVILFPLLLDRYLAEFDFRQNTRANLGIDDAQRAATAVQRSKGKRLKYQTTNSEAEA